MLPPLALAERSRVSAPVIVDKLVASVRACLAIRSRKASATGLPWIRSAGSPTPTTSYSKSMPLTSIGLGVPTFGRRRNPLQNRNFRVVSVRRRGYRTPGYCSFGSISRVFGIPQTSERRPGRGRVGPWKGRPMSANRYSPARRETACICRITDSSWRRLAIHCLYRSASWADSRRDTVLPASFQVS